MPTRENLVVQDGEFYVGDSPAPVALLRALNKQLGNKWSKKLYSQYQSPADFPGGSAPVGAINEAANTWVDVAGYPQTVTPPEDMMADLTHFRGWACDSTTGDARFRVLVDGVVVAEEREESQDAAGVDPENAAKGTDQRRTGALMTAPFLIEATGTDITVQFAPSQNTVECSVWRVNMKVEEA